MKSTGMHSKREISKRASSVPSVSLDSVSMEKINFVEDLQRNIEADLARIQKVAREYCLLSEEHIILKKKLNVMKKNLEDSKGLRRDHLDLKRTEKKSYDRKFKITETQVNKISAELEALRDQVDSMRKMKIFNTEADQRNKRRLIHNLDKNYKRSESIHLYRSQAKRNLENFHGVIAQAKVKKLMALDVIKKIRKNMPRVSDTRNAKMKYYKDMEEYEIISRKLLRNRIKKTLMRNTKKINLTLTYVNDMQAIDTCFTTIKQRESIDSIVPIIDIMKRYHDKSNEMYSKMSAVSNQVDNYQQKIEVGGQYNLSIMELTSKLKIDNDKEEENGADNNQRFVEMKAGLRSDLAEHRTVLRECKETCVDEYKDWLEKSAAQNVLVPLEKPEIEFEEMSINKYQGFLEAMVKGLLKFKEEKLERDRLEEIKRQKEIEQRRNNNKNSKARRRKRKVYVESRGGRSNRGNSPSKSRRSQSRSQGSGSRSRNNVRLASKSSLNSKSRSRRNLSKTSNIYQKKSYRQSGKTRNKLSSTRLMNSDSTGLIETENTLPSILDHRRFQRELRNISKKLAVDKGDRYSRNASIFDLKKVKEKHRNLFNRRNQSVDLGYRSMSQHKKYSEKKEFGNASMIN